MWMQALDTIVPFYAVLLASAQLLPCLSAPHPHPGIPWLVMTGMDEMIRAVVWLQFVPNTSAVKPSLNPLVTSSLSI
jgi:hypothetical protein